MTLYFGTELLVLEIFGRGTVGLARASELQTFRYISTLQLEHVSYRFSCLLPQGIDMIVTDSAPETFIETSNWVKECCHDGIYFTFQI